MRDAPIPSDEYDVLSDGHHLRQNCVQTFLKNNLAVERLRLVVGFQGISRLSSTSIFLR